MKRISILLAICLLLGIPAQAAAPAVFQYQSSQLGFSITVPGICQGEVIAEETDTGVNFYHAPSREKYGGEIGSVAVVSPRSDFFSGHYDDMAYQIITNIAGAERIFEILDTESKISDADGVTKLPPVKGAAGRQRYMACGYDEMSISRHLRGIRMS